MVRKLFRNRKGQGLVEYALIVAGVALVAAAAISVFGHKVNDMIAATAVVLPGANGQDNGAIASGRIVETTSAVNGNIGLDSVGIVQDGAGGQSRLFGNLFGYTSDAAGNPAALVPEAN